MSAQSFTAENAAMLLIDHQVGAMGWVRSISFEQMKANALALAQTAKVVDIPLVLTCAPSTPPMRPAALRRRPSQNPSSTPTP